MRVRNLSREGKAGFLVLLILNSSFLFLLFAPFIPNLIGEALDAQLLAGCDERIRAYRMGSIHIQLRNQTTGLPIQGWNISYEHIQHEFLFGCGFFYYNNFGNPVINAAYRDSFKQVFNLAVLPYYWYTYEPTENYFPTETRLNATLQWCSKNNITPKGHTLAWTRPPSIPDWVLQMNDSMMVESLEHRITTLVSKFKENISDWDVVNEPIHSETYADMSQIEFTYNSLIWARASNPNAQLTVNEFGIIGHDFGYGPFYQHISQLIALNAPFDIIGLEGREPRQDWVPATELWQTLDAYADFGKPLHITEFLAPSIPVPITNSWKKGLWSEENQAEYATRFYKVAFSHPACKAIIWWDLSDLRSWVEGSGILRADMTPKPSYIALDQLINHEWRTTGSQTSNLTGAIEFQGFYGLYNVSIQDGAYQFQINLESGAPNQFLLEI